MRPSGKPAMLDPLPEPPLPPVPAPSPRRHRRHPLRLLLKLGLVAAAFYFAWRLVAGMRWAELAARLGVASWPLVAASLFFLVFRFALWDLRFRLAAGRALATRPPGAAFGFSVLLASSALHLLNPAARVLAGPFRARSFARAGDRSFGQVYGVVLYDQLAHQTTISLLTCLAVLAAAIARGYGVPGLLGVAVLVAGVVGVVVWSRRRGPFADNPLVRFLARRADQAEGGLQRVYSQGHQAADTFVKLLGDAGMALRAAGLGTILFLANAVAQWLIFLALGQRVGLLPVIAVVALGNAAGMLAGTPGGIGTTEAAMVAAFVALGVDRASAGAATLLFRGLHYVLVLAVGLPALGWLATRSR